MAKRIRSERQPMVNNKKKLHQKLKIEPHNFIKNQGWSQITVLSVWIWDMYNSCVTDDHGYIPFIIVKIHSFLFHQIFTVTQQVPLVQQELLIIPTIFFLNTLHITMNWEGWGVSFYELYSSLFLSVCIIFIVPVY
jgi:hypothetical protein